jgi:predicted ATPase
LLLLGLDNLSGLDEMSWKVLQGLFYCGNNVFIMGAARNEFDLNVSALDWDNMKVKEDQFLHLQLEALDEKEVLELVNANLRGRGFTKFQQNVARTVFLECKGNPLLACEILDALYPSFSTSEVPAFASSTVKNVEELVLNRLDSLSPSVRPFLNLGAILGPQFYLSDVTAVMERYYEVSEQEEKVDICETARASLQEAVDNGLLSISAYEYLDFGLREATAYSFSHSMWRETIVNQILDEWKNAMQQLINDILLKRGKVSSKISPFKRTRHAMMPVIQEGQREEPGDDGDEPSKEMAPVGVKEKPLNRRLQAVTKIFRLSYKASGRKGASESLRKLKGMLKGSKDSVGR